MTIPNSVTAIGEWAFRDCWNLTSLTIENPNIKTSSYTFDGCYSLKTVKGSACRIWVNGAIVESEEYKKWATQQAAVRKKAAAKAAAVRKKKAAVAAANAASARQKAEAKAQRAARRNAAKTSSNKNKNALKK